MPQCNAPTQTSGPCLREVAIDGDRCWDHGPDRQRYRARCQRIDWQAVRNKFAVPGCVALWVRFYANGKCRYGLVHVRDSSPASHDLALAWLEAKGHSDWGAIDHRLPRYNVVMEPTPIFDVIL